MDKQDTSSELYCMATLGHHQKLFDPLCKGTLFTFTDLWE